MGGDPDSGNPRRIGVVDDALFADALRSPRASWPTHFPAIARSASTHPAVHCAHRHADAPLACAAQRLYASGQKRLLTRLRAWHGRLIAWESTDGRDEDFARGWGGELSKQRRLPPAETAGGLRSLGQRATMLTR